MPWNNDVMIKKKHEVRSRMKSMELKNKCTLIR